MPDGGRERVGNRGRREILVVTNGASLSRP
jgi:hypothetical protein